MALVIKLAENAAATHTDKITLKAENENFVVERSPISIGIPGGTVFGLDMGRMVNRITYQGIVDLSLEELFVDATTIANGPFVSGETITGTAAWNATTTPVRTATPTGIVYAGIPSLSAPTSLIISSWTTVLDDNNFLVDGEGITGTGGATIDVKEPFPSRRRLWQASRYWYANGALTLTTRDGDFSVQIKNCSFEAESGKEDRFRFKLDLVQVA